MTRGGSEVAPGHRYGKRHDVHSLTFPAGGWWSYMFENSTHDPRKMSAMAKVFYPRDASANGLCPKGGGARVSIGPKGHERSSADTQIRIDKRFPDESTKMIDSSLVEARLRPEIFTCLFE